MDDSSNRYNILDEEMIERATIVVVGIVGSEYLCTLCGVNGAPLSCAVRK